MNCAQCGKPLPEFAVANQDTYCSRPGVPELTMRQLGGVSPAVTVLALEAAARDLEARARLARERGSGRHHAGQGL